jgi:Xaa-Pro aminopeptidase
MKKVTLLLFFIVLSLSTYAQNSDLPSDFLTSTFHKGRRAELRKNLPNNSVAVFFANPVRNRANDVDYVYHQDPDFFYLTGYREPNAVLLVFKEKQSSPNGEQYDEIIFVQPRDVNSEMWTGRRLGPQGANDRLGLQLAFNNSEFGRYNLDFKKFGQVLFIDFQNDVRDDQGDSSDMFDLIKQFKVKTAYPEKNSLVVSQEPSKSNLDAKSLHGIMDRLRGIKTAEELEMVKKAVRISCMGQVEVMKAMKPGMSEREVQGIHEFVFKKYQAEDLGYPSIVGAGHNGCILHYIDNYKPEITSKELILMDLGAEFHGYTADITRTIPVNGKFSPEQKQIYELVLAAQEEAMKVCKPGANFSELFMATKKVIDKGLADLGVIKLNQPHRYYPHGCCHHIGLDVHDRGEYSKLQENMVITIEPGIYIPDNSPCDPKWWGISVRIEDDYLLTKNGYEHLSKSAPRTVKDIEDTMKLTSPLDSFVLPPIDKEK